MIFCRVGLPGSSRRALLPEVEKWLMTVSYLLQGECRKQHLHITDTERQYSGIWGSPAPKANFPLRLDLSLEVKTSSLSLTTLCLSPVLDFSVELLFQLLSQHHSLLPNICNPLAHSSLHHSSSWRALLPEPLPPAPPRPLP